MCAWSVFICTSPNNAHRHGLTTRMALAGAVYTGGVSSANSEEHTHTHTHTRTRAHTHTHTHTQCTLEVCPQQTVKNTHTHNTHTHTHTHTHRKKSCLLNAYPLQCYASQPCYCTLFRTSSTLRGSGHFQSSNVTFHSTRRSRPRKPWLRQQLQRRVSLSVSVTGESDYKTCN